MIQNLKSEFRHFALVNPAPYNPRVRLQPGDAEYQQILKSLQEFGYLGGMVWNKRTGNLVGGHQRMWIMQDQGMQGSEMAVVDLDDAREKDLNLRLNKIGGRWDTPQLEAVLRELETIPEIDLKALGWNPVELNELLGKTQKKSRRDPDAAAILPLKAMTKVGDVWTLAGPDLNPEHRLICGNSEKPETFRKLMDDKRARLVFTEPPHRMTFVNQGGTVQAAVDDVLRSTVLVDFLTESFKAIYPHTDDKAAIYCFYAATHHLDFENALRAAGWRVKQQLVWLKQMVLGRSDYHWSHEPILYGCKQGQDCEWLGPRTEKTLFEMNSEDVARLKKDEAIALLQALKQQTDAWEERRDPPTLYIHPTQKPTSLAGRAMRNSSMPGDIVLDAFMGSGSTLIAGELNRRAVYGVEQSDTHCDSIVLRFLETFEDSVAHRNGQPVTIGDLLMAENDGPQEEEENEEEA